MRQRSPDAGGDDEAYADEPAPLAPKQTATLLDASRRDRDHLAQLTALTQPLVWPAMGNARRFSEPGA